MKKLFFILCLFLVNTPWLLFADTPGKVLIIADIDDTLKQTYVRSKVASVVNSLLENPQPFAGMADLLREVTQQNNSPIHYVSNAPSLLLQHKHSEFLRKFKFPQAHNIHTRLNIFDSQFKVKKIQNLIQSERPQTLILIGDNGEKDPSVYQEIYNTAGGLGVKKLFTFIHIAYSQNGGNDDEPISPLFPTQTPYVTPVEISLILFQNGLFPSPSSYITRTHSSILKTPESSFPFWKTCSIFHWPFSQELTQQAGLRNFSQWIQRRCSAASDNHQLLHEAEEVEKFLLKNSKAL